MLVWHFWWIFVGIIGSAFFAIETGLISLNRVRLRHDVERKNRRARILSEFVEDSDRLLGTTMVGTNLSNTIVAVFIASLASHTFGSYYGVELGATILAAGFVLVVGEMAPKTLFRRYAYRMCMTSAYFLNAAAWLFAPLVAVLGMVMRLVALIGRSEDEPKSFFVTREELKLLAREGETGGELTPEERQMIHGVFDFPHKTVHEVMVPLGRTVTVSANTTIKELSDISLRTGFARFPVREADKMVGVVNTYEVLFENAEIDDHTIAEFMRKPQLVLSTERINRVLPVLRAGRYPISLVVNPEGKHVGIITIEDIVEEIVGDVEG